MDFIKETQFLDTEFLVQKEKEDKNWPKTPFFDGFLKEIEGFSQKVDDFNLINVEAEKMK